VRVVLLCLLLAGCTYADAFKFLTGAASDGLSVDAQIGDRQNSGALGDSSSIGEIEVDDGDLNLDQSKASFQGNADSVTINDTSAMPLIIALACGVFMGLFLPQIKLK